MIFLEKSELLITGSWDSNIKIYDCSVSNGETKILRIMAGGHNDSEITALVYSDHIALLASGS